MSIEDDFMDFIFLVIRVADRLLTLTGLFLGHYKGSRWRFEHTVSWIIEREEEKMMIRGQK